MAGTKSTNRRGLDPATKDGSGLAVARALAHRPNAKRPSSMMHVRIEDDLKRDAASTLEQIGLSMPEAIRLFLRRVVIEKTLPLRLDVPSDKAIRAMEEANTPGLKRFASARELFDDLQEGRRE